MGSPRRKRLCLLFLIGLVLSVIFLGHYYTADSPLCVGTAARTQQQETWDLEHTEILQDVRNRDLIRRAVMKRRNSTKDVSSPKEKSRLCLSSLKSRVKHNPTFEKQFDFDIPVFIWEQHFTPETWARLKDRSVPYGWRDVPYPGITVPQRPIVKMHK